MLELWARKRPIDGRGFPYEYITSFSNEEQKYYLSDQLDREIYEECMIVKDNICIFYREFEKPMIYRKVRNENTK